MAHIFKYKNKNDFCGVKNVLLLARDTLLKSTDGFLVYNQTSRHMKIQPCNTVIMRSK